LTDRPETKEQREELNKKKEQIEEHIAEGALEVFKQLHHATKDVEKKTPPPRPPRPSKKIVEKKAPPIPPRPVKVETTPCETITVTDDTEQTDTTPCETITVTDDVKHAESKDNETITITDEVKHVDVKEILERKVKRNFYQDCKCGSKITQKDIHERTKKHRDYINNVPTVPLSNACYSSRYYEKHRNDRYICECGKEGKAHSLKQHLTSRQHRNFLDGKETLPRSNHMVDCPCGSHFLKYELPKHLRTHKHLEYVANLEKTGMRTFYW
jgi:hypothetical protein